MRLIKASNIIGFKYNDGGATKGETDDCVVRALAIYTRKDYYEVLQALHDKLDATFADMDDETLADYISREEALLAWYEDEYTSAGNLRGGWDPEIYSQVYEDFGLKEVGKRLKDINLTEAHNKYGNCIAVVHEHVLALMDGYAHDKKDLRFHKDPRISKDGQLLVKSVWK